MLPVEVELTQQEKNIKIAEACGWSVDKSGWWSHPTLPDNGGALTEPPSYFSDLNEIHAAEMQHFDALVARQYWLILSDVMGNGLQVGHWSATAEQHSEAFGLALSLW